MDADTAKCFGVVMDALLKVARAIGAVHIEAIATKTEGMTREQLIERIDITSESISKMVDAISDAATVIKGEIDGGR